MRSLHLYTQCRENCGDSDAPQWKLNGGQTIVVTDIGDASLDTLLEHWSPRVEIFNPIFEEYICGYSIQLDEAPNDGKP